MGSTDAGQKVGGRATVLAIGTANPANAVDQTTYPDFYFKATNSEHMTDLKDKFKRMCEKTMINNRYLHVTEDLLHDNPSMCIFGEPSLNARHEILTEEIPKLGKEAATRAVKEWGRQKSNITHLVFCSTGGPDSPGADFKLTKLMGLDLSVKRYMLYQQGCYGGGTALRLAKDLAENNKGARVLVVCCEITVSTFHGPSEARPDNLLGQGLFGDGAAALIVGVNPIVGVEKGLFEMTSVAQTIVPNSDNAVKIQLRQEGLDVHLEKNVCGLISANITKILEQEFAPLGVYDYESLFWIVHPGGAAILNEVEEKLKLPASKLAASRQVLREYGNMASASVLFIMNQMRKNSARDGLGTTGEGLEWGVLFGFGPGITVETVVLRSVIT